MFSWFGLLCCCCVQLLWQGDVALMGVRPIVDWDTILFTYLLIYLNDLYGERWESGIHKGSFFWLLHSSLPPWKRLLSRLKLPSISEDPQFHSIEAPWRPCIGFETAPFSASVEKPWSAYVSGSELGGDGQGGLSETAGSVWNSLPHEMSYFLLRWCSVDI